MTTLKFTLVKKVLKLIIFKSRQFVILYFGRVIFIIQHNIFYLGKLKASLFIIVWQV